MKRVRLLALTLLLALAAPVVSDEARPDPKADEWRRALTWLREPDRSSELDERDLLALDPMLPSFDPDALDAQAVTDEVDQLPDDDGPRVRRALRALAHLRRLRAHLDGAPSIALLLGSDDEVAWSKALLDLCRRPFDERLGAVAERLSTHPTAAFRVMAGRLVNYLNAFCGGSGSAWGAKHRTAWDPTPLARRVAKRLLEDRNPAVACVFAMYDAYALEDPEVIDRMVEHLTDLRQTPRVPWGLLQVSEQTVGEACRFSLDAQFRFHREDRGHRQRPPDLRRVVSLPSDESPDAIARWWKENRAGWSFTPDGPTWTEVLDRLVVVRPDEAVDVDSPLGKLRVRLSSYAEHPGGRSPELSIHVEVDDLEDLVHLDLGNPQHHLGYAGRSTATSGVGWLTGWLMYAPETEAGVRMRVRLYSSPWRR